MINERQVGDLGLEGTSSKTILIGLGPYAKRHYINFFKKYLYFPEFIIDMESKKEYIENFLMSSHLDIPFYLISDLYRDIETLPEDQKQNILCLLKKHEITHAIIATEPKAHLSYLDFLIENGIHVLVEKPLTASINTSFCMHAAEKVEKDYWDLLRKIQASPTATFYLFKSTLYRVERQNVNQAVLLTIHVLGFHQ